MCVLWEDVRGSRRQQEARPEAREGVRKPAQDTSVFHLLLCPCCEHRAHLRVGGRKCILNHKPTDHQKKAPKAMAMEAAIPKKFKEFSLTMELGREYFRHPGCEG